MFLYFALNAPGGLSCLCLSVLIVRNLGTETQQLLLCRRLCSKLLSEALFVRVERGLCLIHARLQCGDLLCRGPCAEPIHLGLSCEHLCLGLSRRGFCLVGLSPQGLRVLALCVEMSQ